MKYKVTKFIVQEILFVLAGSIVGSIIGIYIGIYLKNR